MNRIKTNETRQVSEDVKYELFEMIDQLFQFASNQYEEELENTASDFLKTTNLSNELAASIVPHIYCWNVFCVPINPEEQTIYQSFLEKHSSQFRQNPMLIENLRNIQFITPSFYYVYKIEKSRRVLVLDDMFEMKSKLVSVYNEIYEEPKKGEILTGLLLPFIDGTYTPVIDFFHIPEKEAKKVANAIIDYYEQKLAATKYDFSLKQYPELLTVALRTMLQSK